MSNQNITILSRHKTLSEAVKAAEIDLSYNEPLALSKIKDLECGFRGCKSGEAFVTTEGVFYVYQCDIRLLNKFEPFNGCLDNSPFHIAEIRDKHIYISDATIPKTSGNRKRIAELGLLVVA